MVESASFDGNGAKKICHLESDPGFLVTQLSCSSNQAIHSGDSVSVSRTISTLMNSVFTGLSIVAFGRSGGSLSGVERMAVRKLGK